MVLKNLVTVCSRILTVYCMLFVMHEHGSLRYQCSLARGVMLALFQDSTTKAKVNEGGVLRHYNFNLQPTTLVVVVSQQQNIPVLEVH